MFCPSCGAEYTIELKYCNRCGANLSTDLEQSSAIVPINVTKPTLAIGATMIILTLIGFGLLMGGAIELSRGARIDPDSITAIVVIGMLTILTTDIFLVRLLSRLINAALSAGQVSQAQRPKVRANVQPPQLQPPTAARQFQGAPSVTENTTRFFEPYRVPAESADRTTSEKLERKIES
jgi:hypothetical protein